MLVWALGGGRDITRKAKAKGGTEVGSAASWLI